MTYLRLLHTYYSFGLYQYITLPVLEILTLIGSISVNTEISIKLTIKEQLLTCRSFIHNSIPYNKYRKDLHKYEYKSNKSTSLCSVDLRI